MSVFESQSPRSINVELGERVYLITIVPVKDPNYANVYGKEISDRKTMEALKQSDEKLKALHRHARTLAVTNTIEEVAKHTLDANGVYLRVRCRRLLYSRGRSHSRLRIQRNTGVAFGLAARRSWRSGQERRDQENAQDSGR